MVLRRLKDIGATKTHDSLSKLDLRIGLGYDTPCVSLCSFSSSSLPVPQKPQTAHVKVPAVCCVVLEALRDGKTVRYIQYGLAKENSPSALYPWRP